MSIKIPFATVGDTVGFPLTANRQMEWKCPQCGMAVVVKRGKLKQAHFAHKSTSTCTGETLLHKATKEWVSTQVNNSDFTITSRCQSCSTAMTMFRGSAALSGATEVTVHYDRYGCRNSTNKYHECSEYCISVTTPSVYRVDTAAMHNCKPVAYIEVAHSHGTASKKMIHLASVSYNNAFEVSAIDLVAETYPMEFRDIRQRRCRPCLRKALATQRAALEFAADNNARRHARMWLDVVNLHKKAREEHFGRRWLLLYYVKKCASRIRAAHSALIESMTAPCGKCDTPVQLWQWVPYKDDNYKWHRFRRVDCEDYELDNSVYYHRRCSPVCIDCGETKKIKKWCACQRAKHRKCADCKEWFQKDEMHEAIVSLFGRGSTEYVCKTCAVACRLCKKAISKKQAKYGGACFHCNLRNKRKRKGVDPDNGVCTNCGKGIDERFTVCYGCKFV